MKIVYVHSSLPVGGAEILRGIVARELLTRKVDFRICLLSSGGIIGESLREVGAKVDVLGTGNSIYNIRNTFKLKSYFKKHHPDIVHSSQFNSNFHTRIAAKISHIPVVICEEHGLYYWKHWWHRWADRLLVHWCDKVLAVSEAVKRFNLEKIGLPAKTMQVFPNCIDTHKFQLENRKDREKIRNEIGLKDTDFVFGHVGTLRHEKGHDILLQSFAELRKKYHAKLLLVGDGPLRSDLEEMCDTLGLVNDVIFCGTREDIPAILTALDVFVFPSRNEALGIALLEAMYSGLPVIGTQVGGIPEIITNRETGLLVPTENMDALCDSMIDLYENDMLRKKLGKAAQNYVAQNHDPVVYVDRLLALYDELLKKKGIQ